jgi:hypothetical protein
LPHKAFAEKSADIVFWQTIWTVRRSLAGQQLLCVYIALLEQVLSPIDRP